MHGLAGWLDLHVGPSVARMGILAKVFFFLCLSLYYIMLSLLLVLVLVSGVALLGGVAATKSWRPATPGDAVVSCWTQ